MLLRRLFCDAQSNILGYMWIYHILMSPQFLFLSIPNTMDDSIVYDDSPLYPAALSVDTSPKDTIPRKARAAWWKVNEDQDKRQRFRSLPMCNAAEPYTMAFMAFHAPPYNQSTDYAIFNDRKSMRVYASLVLFSGTKGLRGLLYSPLIFGFIHSLEWTLKDLAEVDWRTLSNRHPVSHQKVRQG